MWMGLNVARGQDFSAVIDAAAAMIADTQKTSGEIPWSRGDKTDPWDHVEAAMGLSVAGYLDEARRAFEWMTQTQLGDGSWHASWMDGEPLEMRRDANMTSYIAVGVFHYFLITGDRGFLEWIWNTVENAIEFALSLQAPGGEIRWCVNQDGKVDPMALLTGSSSIHMSVKCALAVAEQLGLEKPAWRKSMEQLGNAIRNKPLLFNMTKSRYSMDWFYPILCGAVTGESARGRIEKYWKKNSMTWMPKIKP